MTLCAGRGGEDSRTGNQIYLSKAIPKVLQAARSAQKCPAPGSRPHAIPLTRLSLKGRPAHKEVPQPSRLPILPNPESPRLQAFPLHPAPTMARSLLGLRVGGGSDAEAERCRLVYAPKLARRRGFSFGSRDRHGSAFWTLPPSAEDLELANSSLAWLTRVKISEWRGSLHSSRFR